MRAFTSLLPVLVLAAPAAAAQELDFSFDAPLVVNEDAESAPFQRLFDFDADGWMDAVGAVVREDGNLARVRVWRNDQKGRLVPALEEDTAPPFVVSGTVLLDVEVGDFDGDGDDDFVLGGQLAYLLYTSEPDGSFSKTLVPTPSFVVDLATGDYDGDGKDDIALLRWSTPATATGVDVFFGSGASAALPIAIDGHTELRTLDADGDGSDDLLAVLDETAELYAVTATDATLLATLTAGAAYKTLWTAGDVDADGDDDVVAFGIPSSSAADRFYDLFENVGGAWQALPTGIGGPAEYLADLDGDGDLDGVCCGGGFDPDFPKLDFESTFEVALNDGGLAFEPSFEIPGLGAWSLGGAADLDQDGDVDLVAGRCVHYARGALTSAPMPEMPFSYATFREHMIHDLDRDGDPEQAHVQGKWNLGDGSFSDELNQPAWPEDPPGTDITGPNWFGDFTGDGAPDWIYTRYSLNPPGFVQMELIRNTGGGGYVLGGPAAAPGHSFNPFENSADNGFSTDVDGDGDVDLWVLVSDGFGGVSSVFYRNDGSGFLEDAEALAGSHVVAMADFNQDGHADALSVALGNDESLFLHEGTGSASSPYFGAALALAPGIVTVPEDREHVVSDFNDDGWPDVGFVDADDRPRVLFNTTAAPGAQASFVLSDLLFDYQTQWVVRARVIGIDADHDGWTDLVVGPFADHPRSAYIFLRKPGTGGVLTLADYETPVLQVLPGLYARDVDGDGDTDLMGEYIAKSAAFHPSYGDGARVQAHAPTSGAGGMVPILGATGPFRAGESVQLRLSGAVGGALSVLVFSPHQASLLDFPVVGANLYVDPFQPGFAQVQVPLAGAPGAPGAGTFGVGGFVVPAEIAGLTFYHQVFVIDFSAPGAVVSSNLLALTYGP
ncbi:MAG: FG-GAP-like repeat-containing protein [Planctomycetota bacterium]